MNTRTTTPPADVLALRPRDAARALGISERCLWSLTQRGEVPHVKIGGRLVLYPRAGLVDWLDRAAKQTAQQSADAAEFARIIADIDRTTEELQATIDEIKRQEGTADA
jgi:excisionase family DNA binding protein